MTGVGVVDGKRSRSLLRVLPIVAAVILVALLAGGCGGGDGNETGDPVPVRP